MQGIAHLLNHTSFLEQWLHSMNVAIAIVEQNNDLYTYTYMNEEMKKSYGDCIGESIDDVHSREEAEVLIHSLEQSEMNKAFEISSSFPNRLNIHSIPSTKSFILQWDKGNLPETVADNYQSIVESSADSIVVHNESNEIVYANRAGIELLGAKRISECIGLNVESLLQDEQESEVQSRLRRVFADEFKTVVPIERKLQRLDGKVIEVELSGAKLFFNGEPAIQTVCRNISERRQKQSRLEEMAYYDQLTQVSNRRYFFNQLQMELQEVEENESILSLLFIDLDNFKDINDQYGHHVGDEVLVIFTKRVKQMLRDTDTFSRLGGDEFVVLLTNLQSSSDPEQVAERMIERVTQPIIIDEKELHISVSIGISIYPDHGKTRDDLLTKADQALYEAKNNGRKCVEVYKHRACHLTL